MALLAAAKLVVSRYDAARADDRSSSEGSRSSPVEPSNLTAEKLTHVNQAQLTSCSAPPSNIARVLHPSL
jgi:hypothetical protein